MANLRVALFAFVIAITAAAICSSCGFVLPSGAGSSVRDFVAGASNAAASGRRQWRESAVGASHAGVGLVALVAVAATSSAFTLRQALSRGVGSKRCKVIVHCAEEEEREGEAQGEVFAAGMIGSQSAFTSFDYNFDPLDLSRRYPGSLAWFRETEQKHGRIAMLAWVGLVVPDVVRIPGPSACYSADVIDAHDACVGPNSYEPVGPMLQILLFIGIVEMLTVFPKVVEGLTTENAGDYRLGISFLPEDEAKAKEMKLKELKNGRLAMIGFGGAITQAALSGNSFPWLYAAPRSQLACRPGAPFVGKSAPGSKRASKM